MPFKHHNHIINLSIIISFSVICLLVNNVKCHKCYVCGLDNNSPSCDTFDPSSDIFTKECPSNTQSCSLHRKDDSVIRRSCEDILISDCQKANDVLYCYCASNLCNGEEIIPYPPESRIPSDDEDILEGSGFTRKTNHRGKNRGEKARQDKTNSGQSFDGKIQTERKNRIENTSEKGKTGSEKTGNENTKKTENEKTNQHGIKEDTRHGDTDGTTTKSSNGVNLGVALWSSVLFIAVLFVH